MMTIPNLLTIGRILLTPVLAWLILQGRLTSALVLFFIAGMSDAVDGFLARHFNQKSKFGAYMDPLADKALLVTSFVVLCYIGLIPTWLTVITVARDLMILSGFFALYLSGVKVEMRPLAVSKATTFFQLLTVFTMLGSSLIELPGPAYTALFLVTAAFSVYSGGRYVQTGMSLVAQHRGRMTDDR
ncbi:MAG: CDP-alcohol phosphatidyltransferase family protein [Syntrophobacteraceae bacterium]